MNRNYLLIFLLAVVLLFAFNSQLPITDPVECNYALTSKEMVESGDWLSPQIYGKYWFDKPIFFYWLTALGYKLFGFTDFASRFFPAVFGLASVGLTAWFTHKIYNEKTAIYSATILTTCVSLFLVSKAIITDAALFFFFNVCIAFFFLGYTQNKNYYFGTYIFAALSTLTKGPIGFLLPGLIFVLFLLSQRNWRELREIRIVGGTFLFLLVAVPWYYFMYQTHGSAFTDIFLGTHNYLRATVSEHPSDNVIYYYTAVLILGFFPWSAYLPSFIYDTYKQGRRGLGVREIYLFIWALTIIIFYQNMATKYPTYTYPSLMPIGILLANYLANKTDGLFSRAAFIFNGVFAVLFVITYFIVKKTNPAMENSSVWPLALAVIFFVGFGGYQVFKRQKYVLAALALGTAFIYLGLIQTLALSLVDVRSGKDLGMLLRTLPITENTTIGTYTDYSTSAVFYSGHNIYKLVTEVDKTPTTAKAYSWASKQVMPQFAFKNLKPGDYVLSRDVARRPIDDKFLEKLEYIGSAQRWTVYKIK